MCEREREKDRERVCARERERERERVWERERKSERGKKRLFSTFLSELAFKSLQSRFLSLLTLIMY